MAACKGITQPQNINGGSHVLTETTLPKLDLAELSAAQQVMDLTDYFEGINGCMVVYNPKKFQYYSYNKELSEYRSSPCSTFKIISSGIGLEKGIINSIDSVFKWNGTKYWKSEWNKDIGYLEAFQTSCVWYFRKVIDLLGKRVVQENLEQLHYGNCDISDWEGRQNTNNNNRDLTGFWIESSLRISPKEQTEVLSRIFEGKMGFSEETLHLLKEAMMVKSSENQVQIYGKTGMGVKDGKCIDAWYVGMFELEDEMSYFAVRLDDPDKNAVTSQKAKEIGISVINQYFN